MSLGALYDPTLLPPVDGLSSSSSSSCGHGDHPRRNEQNSVNNGVPRAVLFLLEFQGELRHERTFTITLQASLSDGVELLPLKVEMVLMECGIFEI
jgi:hypothetical protein